MAFEVTFAKDKYVDEAEAVILSLKNTNFEFLNGRRKDQLTSSQLRGILASTSTIYDIVRNQGPEAAEERLSYLRVELVYQSGRNAAVKEFVKQSGLLTFLEIIQNVIDEGDVKHERTFIIRFCRYMEALVAYFKFYGGE